MLNSVSLTCPSRHILSKTQMVVFLDFWFLVNPLWIKIVIIYFLIYSQFRVIQKPVSGSIVFKAYISINVNLLSYKKWKQEWKISNTGLILLPWVKVLFLPKNTNFFQKNAAISKIKGSWWLISETYIGNFKFPA